MKSSRVGLAVLAFTFLSAASRATIVYDATHSAEPIWWYGLGNYQENGCVIELAGTERALESVTLHQFAYQTGEFNITAAIYAVPDVINDFDVLTNPLWSSTVHKSLTGDGGVFAMDIVFTGPSFQLPDRLVLNFSFTAESGNGAFMLQNLKLNSDPQNRPAVGDIVSLANYEGMPGVPGSWYNYEPDAEYWVYAQGSINASAVPDPASIIALGFGIVGLLGRRMARRK